MKKFIMFLRLIIIISIILSVLLFIDNCTFETNYYDLSKYSPESFRGTTIVQISDLHNEQFGIRNKYLIEKLEEINPDYIFITGDMVSAEDVDFTGIYSLTEEIGKKYKCYFVIGNHENGLTNSSFNTLINSLIAYGIEFLNNKKIDLNDDVSLYGVDYADKYYIKSKYGVQEMENDVGKAEKDKYNIRITHNPNDFDTYSSWGADLIFTGHTHGGMVRLFDVGIISTDRTLFPQYDGGLYYSGDSVMINSRGLSRGHVGVRLFNRPEIVVANF